MSNSFDDEMLVAFLDGELPRDEAAVIEHAVESNADLQRRLATLDATWNLLGELPAETPNHRLAESTIEMVTLTHARESRSWGDWLRQRRLPLLLACTLAALLGGLGLGSLLSRWKTRALLRQMHVVVDYAGLEHIESVEFLEALAELPSLEQLGKQTRVAAEQAPPLPDAWNERRTWLDELPMQTRERLRLQLDDFEAEPPESKQKLVQLGEYIQSQGERTQELLDGLRAYTKLLALVPAPFEKELRQSDKGLAEKMQIIEARANEELAFRYKPSQADRIAIRDWLDEVREALLSISLNSFLNFDAEQEIAEELLRPDANNWLVTPADVERLIQDRLSASARELVLGLQDTETQRAALWLWVTSVIESNRQTGQEQLTVFDVQDYKNAFQAVPKTKRELMMILPEENVREELRSTLRRSGNRQDG